MGIISARLLGYLWPLDRVGITGTAIAFVLINGVLSIKLQAISPAGFATGFPFVAASSIRRQTVSSPAGFEPALRSRYDKRRVACARAGPSIAPDLARRRTKILVCFYAKVYFFDQLISKLRQPGDLALPALSRFRGSVYLG